MSKENYPKNIPHSLNNQHIDYKYLEQDYSGVGDAIALFQLVDGEMREIYHPASYHSESVGITDKCIGELVEVMQKREINKVYSVSHLEDFFGIPNDTFPIHGENHPSADEVWAEYESIFEGSYEHQALVNSGIEVIFYQEPPISKESRETFKVVNSFFGIN